MIVPVWRGRVDGDGRLLLLGSEQRQRASWLSTLKGQPIELIVRRARSKRTLDQNAYWWGVPVRLLAEHCGYSDDQMHYALLGECFGYTAGPLGQQVPNKASSSALTVEEFTRLIEWVLVWGPTEMGVEIPPPERVAA